MPPIPSEDKDINAKDGLGNTALMIAVDRNNQSAVRELIDLGADVNSIDNKGSTALHHAVDSCKTVDTSVLEELVRGGACVNATNFNGDKPIHMAVRHGSVPTADWLMSNGAVLRERNINGQEIFDIAINARWWTVVDKVLNAARSKRVKSRVSLEQYVADRIDCIDCLNRLNECSPSLGNAVALIKQTREKLQPFSEQQNISNNYLIRRYEHIFRSIWG